MIKVILWDIDGTLLNFGMSEMYAIRKCFSVFGLGECTDEMLARYSAINRRYWERLERSELTRDQVLLGRFQEFFETVGIKPDVAAAFNTEYQMRLGDHAFFNDNGYELIQSLKSKVKQYAVTNGTTTAQERKLALSGLDKLLDGVFISEQLGTDKPNQGFFDTVWREIGVYAPDEVVIVGDSLTSDIQGGNNAGILSCWYNPAGYSNDRGLRIDWEIRDLNEIRKILWQRSVSEKGMDRTMKLLVLDCCVRGELSGTKKYYEAYLNTLDPQTEVEILKLWEQDLRPLGMKEITKRIELVQEGKLEHEMFRWVKQFMEADRVLIAAPYWDWSFPSVLKVYLEHVSISGVTFRYEGAACIGQCRADKILYFATCGGFVEGPHQGVTYIKEIASMFGIPEVEAYIIEGLDIEPGMREKLLEQGIHDMLERVNPADRLTEKLYYTDSHMKEFTAEVILCEEWKEGFRIVLDRTAFFPEGGGQSGDTGELERLPEGGILKVWDTQEKNGSIYHMTDQPLPAGTKVRGRLNYEQRFDRMQQHTGEHIISGIVHGMFGCDNVGFHLGEDITTLDFNLDLTPEQVAEVEQKANQAVFANLPIEILYPDKEILKTMDYRSKIEIEGQVRIVSVPGIDRCACCAPHTYTTGEVGLIKILSCDRHRGGCRMVMVSGGRALKDYQEKQHSVTDISVMLSARPDRISEAVAHAKEQQMKLRGQLNQIQAVYLNEKLDAIQQEDRLVCIFEEEMDNAAVRNFINAAMERCGGICAAFVGNDESGYRYILGSKTENMRELSKVLNDRFAGKGGGKPEMVQGSLMGTEAEIRRLLDVN